MTKENLTVYWGGRYYTSRTQAEGPDGPPSRLYLADEVDELLAKLRAHEPEVPHVRALIEHIEKAGYIYSYEPIFERARDALNRQAESTAERCSICGSTAGPTSSHPHLPGYK